MGRIATLYKGIKFRSRIEADFAFLLDFLQTQWVYEPQSFMLEDGTHYRPDFYILDRNLWIECRGYLSEKGQHQIAQFSKEIMAGKHDDKRFNISTDYGVLSFHPFFIHNKEWLNGMSIRYCDNCERWHIGGTITDCIFCGNSHGDEYSLYISENGYLCVSSSYQEDPMSDSFMDIRVKDWIHLMGLDKKFKNTI